MANSAKGAVAKQRRRFSILGAALLLLAAGCQGSQTGLPVDPPGQLATPVALSALWPTLPADALQPWETLHAAGVAVDTRAGRAGSGLDLDSDFTPGVERFLEGGEASDLGEATRLSSGAPGAGALSFAIYRIGLGGEQPGVLAADVNLRPRDDDTASSYYIGVGNFSRQTWDWYGPFGDNHVRLGLGAMAQAGQDFTSELGNLFVCIAAHDGAGADIVGISVNARNSADFTAPPAPTGLTLTPLAGAIGLQWNSVAAEDLAGYQIYYATAPFTAVDQPGVHRGGYLEGLTSQILPYVEQGPLYSIAITAVDISGNESALSAVRQGQPLAGIVPLLIIKMQDVYITTLNQPVEIEAQSEAGLLYDFDLDGNGIFEITGSSDSTHNVDTSRTGLIRPRVRASGDGGTRMATGGVTLIVTNNSRPVAYGIASPQNGAAPLLVNLNGAASLDFDGEIVGGGWDFEGDGIFDAWDDADIVHLNSFHDYDSPGLYNAKLQVIDDQGAWDVDTVAILVGEPVNQPPFADIQASIVAGDAPLTVDFNASGSADPEGDPLEYAFDWDGNNAYDEFGTVPTVTHTFTEPGLFTVVVRVDDGQGSPDTDTIDINVSAPGNNSPTAVLLPENQSGNIPLTVNFDASGSDAGGDSGDSIVNYEWDFDGDGLFDGYGEDPTITHVYSAAGGFTAKVRVTDSAGAQAADTSAITANVPGNSAPTADVSCSTIEGSAPLPVDFDATASSDADGTIVKYEWDWDGDGAYDAYGSAATASHTYSQPGRYTAVLRVTDNLGGTDVANVDLKAVGWTKYPALLDPIAVSLAIRSISGAAFAGKAGFAYTVSVSGGNDNELRFVLATNSQNLHWNAPVVAVSGLANISGGYLSLNVVSSNPAIAYQNPGDNSLRYVRATASDGSTWGTPIIVDNTVAVGEMSLSIANGNPAIAYFDDTNNRLRYVRATTSLGSLWGAAPITLDDSPGESNGEGPSMLVVNGNPAVSYYNSTDNEVKYIRAVNASGTAWNVAELVAAAISVDHTEMQITGITRPAVAWYDFSPREIRYSNAVDQDGTSWVTAETIASGYTIYDFDLPLGSTVSQLCFFDTDGDDLFYVDSPSTTGFGWGEPYLLDWQEDVGEHCQIVRASEDNVIAYVDNTAPEGLTALLEIE